MIDLINELNNQFKNYPDLYYAKDSGYVSDDPFRLIQLDRFPFYNIMPEGELIEKVDGISFKEMERHIFTLEIQFAVRSIRKNNAIMGNKEENIKGILEMKDDLWSCIISDRTVNKTVNGVLPGSGADIEVFQMDDDIFIAGGTLLISYYSDLAL